MALRRSIPSAWKQVRLLQAGKIASAIALSAVNVLWTGHGVFRSSPVAVRLIAVVVISYVVMTVAEFLWLLYSGPRFTGFESPAPPATGKHAGPLIPRPGGGAQAQAKSHGKLRLFKV